MPLVACHECGKQISSTATACPACGARMRAEPVHVEKTARSIKLHVLAGQMITAAGFIWLLYAGSHVPEDYADDPAGIPGHPFLLPGILILIGFVVWGSGDWRRWWRHG